MQLVANISDPLAKDVSFAFESEREWVAILEVQSGWYVLNTL